MSEPPRSARARRWRTVALALATLVLVVVVLELASAGLFLVVDGRAFSWSRLAAERAAVAGEPAGADQPAQQPLEAPSGLGTQTIHPYVGYVVDPDAEATHEAMARFRLEVDRLGFFRHETFAGEPPPDAFRVAVFGGSVAQIFANRGTLLAAALERHPELGGRPVWVVCRAVPGHKQPQQLAALSWSLAVGEQFDAVVVLDGFNDVVLPLAENLRQGVDPYYPRAWPFRMRAVPDPAVLAKIGQTVVLEAHRRRRAELFSSPLPAASVTANLVWRLLDRRDVGELAAAREALAAADAGERRFATHGAPWTGPTDADGFTAEMAAFWARCARQMHQLATAAGAIYVHVLQPNQYVPGSKPMGAAERATAFDPDHQYRPGVLAGYPHLRQEGEQLAAEGIRFVDATMAFADVAEPLYFDTCCHFNHEGNAILAQRIADEIAAAIAAGEGGPG